MFIDMIKNQTVDVLPSKNQALYKVNYCQSTPIIK